MDTPKNYFLLLKNECRTNRILRQIQGKKTIKNNETKIDKFLQINHFDIENLSNYDQSYEFKKYMESKQLVSYRQNNKSKSVATDTSSNELPSLQRANYCWAHMVYNQSRQRKDKHFKYF